MCNHVFNITVQYYNISEVNRLKNDLTKSDF